MTDTTVYAVMRATIEIPVRASSGGETLHEMLQAATRDAEGALRNRLPSDFRVIGTPEFSHATLKART